MKYILCLSLCVCVDFLNCHFQSNYCALNLINVRTSYTPCIQSNHCNGCGDGISKLRESFAIYAHRRYNRSSSSMNQCVQDNKRTCSICFNPIFFCSSVICLFYIVYGEFSVFCFFFGLVSFGFFFLLICVKRKSSVASLVWYILKSTFD